MRVVGAHARGAQYANIGAHSCTYRRPPVHIVDSGSVWPAGLFRVPQHQGIYTSTSGPVWVSLLFHVLALYYSCSMSTYICMGNTRGTPAVSDESLVHTYTQAEGPMQVIRFCVPNYGIKSCRTNEDGARHCLPGCSSCRVRRKRVRSAF